MLGGRRCRVEGEEVEGEEVTGADDEGVRVYEEVKGGVLHVYVFRGED